jgi:hypothetical protein
MYNLQLLLLEGESRDNDLNANRKGRKAEDKMAI